MIRTLIVEDDFRVAELHRAYTERVPGFAVVGLAGSGAEALRLAGQSRPDLVLLDIYLPDRGGLEVLRALREPERPNVDVIAITAARDLATLRAAMQGGVIHYLIKPFAFHAFEAKLKSYSALRNRMANLAVAQQRDVDRLYGILRPGGNEEELPKGLSAPTLELVGKILDGSLEPLTAVEVARRAGLSRVTARRYLEYLRSHGQADVGMGYGSPGRPEHRYRRVLTQPST